MPPPRITLDTIAANALPFVAHDVIYCTSRCEVVHGGSLRSWGTLVGLLHKRAGGRVLHLKPIESLSVYLFCARGPTFSPTLTLVRAMMLVGSC